MHYFAGLQNKFRTFIFVTLCITPTGRQQTGNTDRSNLTPALPVAPPSVCDSNLAGNTNLKFCFARAKENLHVREFQLEGTEKDDDINCTALHSV